MHRLLLLHTKRPVALLILVVAVATGLLLLAFLCLSQAAVLRLVPRMCLVYDDPILLVVRVDRPVGMSRLEVIHLQLLLELLSGPHTACRMVKVLAVVVFVDRVIVVVVASWPHLSLKVLVVEPIAIILLIFTTL